MLRVLRSILGIQDTKVLPKRQSPLLQLRLATAPAVETHTKPAVETHTKLIEKIAEKKPLPLKTQTVEIAPPSPHPFPISKSKKPLIREKHLGPEKKKQLSKCYAVDTMSEPSDSSFQDAVNIAAIGAFWTEPRYQRDDLQEQEAHTPDDYLFSVRAFGYGSSDYGK